MENKVGIEFKVKVMHGSKEGGRTFEQEFTSRNHFSNYMDILPNDHWKKFEFGGPLGIIDKQEADYIIHDSDDFIIIQVSNIDPFSDGKEKTKRYIVENSIEYLNILSEYDHLEFYEISRMEVANQHEIDPFEDLFDELF